MFGRPRAWARRHPVLIDSVTISPVVLFCLATVPNFSDAQWLGGSRVGMPAGVFLTLALLAPLMLRRKYPREVFAAVALMSFGQWLGGLSELPANIAVLVAMYGVAARCTAAWAVAAGLVAELGLALAQTRYGRFDPNAFASMSVFVIAIWITGIYANTRRRYVEGLVERAERAERERDQQAQIAAAAERTRIARELHDVVAHNVSVMVVQADGAGYAIDSDPEQARRAVQAISATGRTALAEMRRLVGVLRQEGDHRQEYAPQPGVAQLGDLIKQVGDSGLPIDFTVSGVPQALPEGEQLVIYRIVQEALTNTLKHGGPGARAMVDMTYGRGEVLLRISDDGRGAAAIAPDGGHGLVGMRERAAMYGGSIDAGPKVGGGFQVLARIPTGVTV
ncbi:sensor histidine kinase [Planotetraspora kaengkrachanensis]|uniref:histidine kinase n=1 Tax=Planotetraspora kaengkrachanensis TaxID=575193 RepID=A0A8J3PVG1_9ACTN|nr:sensor histidine kinase [Planotetraspora kaengkrachanensis]GIG81795.1 two-component sensor histidine kinase [Planotetraspora kaengkrachanensis]